MNLDVTSSFSRENCINKRLFTLKPLQKNGLILRLRNIELTSQSRFVAASFTKNGQQLACLSIKGRIFLIDLLEQKYWCLVHCYESSKVQFSGGNQLLVALNSGEVLVLDVETEELYTTLHGHKFAVESISFSHDDELSLTSSQFEGILWNWNTFSKMQVLKLNENTLLKFMDFLPVSNHIVACFQDSSLQIWRKNSLETVHELASSGNNILNITCTLNGTALALISHQPIITIYNAENWSVLKKIQLSIVSVKFAQFLPQPFDGGHNKLLLILSGQRKLYFYDIETNCITNELLSFESEIRRFYCSKTGNFLSLILNNGDISLFNISSFIHEDKVKNESTLNKVSSFKLPDKKYEKVKDQINVLMDFEKLKGILKEFGEYPVKYRLKIWEKLLELPLNQEQYNQVINRVTTESFNELTVKYPLENKILIRNLKSLLNNLVSWSPFFAGVNYLPVLAFPFVKVFQNNPVVCFEALATIILNWCRFWFEYFPLPPMNVLAIIDNLLLEHDATLLQHFQQNGISNTIFAWTLLETFFSEVLTTSEWLQLWDHILTNEVSFILCSVAAFCIVNRTKLFGFKELEEFKLFFHVQSPFDFRNFICKTYVILNTTSQELHPRQYLKDFNKIPSGVYPKFNGFPKTVLKIQENLTEKLQNFHEEKLVILNKSNDSLRKLEIDNEEQARQLALQRNSLEEILTRKLEVKEQQKSLEKLQSLLLQDEDNVLELSKKNFNKTKSKLVILGTSLNPAQKHDNNLRLSLLSNYSELLKQKLKLNYLRGKITKEKQLLLLEKHEERLDKKVEKLKGSLAPEKYLTKLNVTTGLQVVEKLIRKLEKEMKNLDETSTNDLRVQRLQTEAQIVEKEITTLLEVLNANRLLINQQ